MSEISQRAKDARPPQHLSMGRTFSSAPDKFYKMPFGASSFEKEKETTRLNLDLDISGMSEE